MALIRCPECSAEISDRAKCCPKCGAPVAVHKWRCAKCGNTISETPCPYCNNTQTVADTNAGVAMNNNTQPVARRKKTKGGLMSGVGTIIAIILILSTYSDWFGALFDSSYYVAKFSSFNAATLQVDGYMHKNKSCCQKVADAFNAEVIRVKPNQSAGTNSYGQTVRYKDCFYYCPLCCT